MIYKAFVFTIANHINFKYFNYSHIDEIVFNILKYLFINISEALIRLINLIIKGAWDTRGMVDFN